MASNPNEVEITSITVDPKRAQKILTWLIQREAENVRTGERGENKMVADIQKRIEEEVQCY